MNKFIQLQHAFWDEGKRYLTPMNVNIEHIERYQDTYIWINGESIMVAESLTQIGQLIKTAMEQ